MDFKEKIEFERQKIADRILERIQNNNLEWSAGWHRFSHNPQNAKTEQRYKGTNMVILYLESLEKGYTDTRWVTFNQAKELGAQVKSGEKATTIFHWNEYDKLTKTVPDWKEINKLPLEEKLQYCRDNIRYRVSYHNVFNAEQCNGLEKFVAPTLSAEEMQKQNEKIERVIAASAAPVLHDGGSRAYYSWKEDKIHLPKIESFKTKDDYYATALHEIAHSTGHESRLNRNLSAGMFGDKTYAIEELRAEFASLFMQSELDIDIDAKHFDNHSAYIQSWAEAIREDKNVLFSAIKDAGDIATYVRENYAESKKENTKKNEGEIMTEEQTKTTDDWKKLPLKISNLIKNYSDFYDESGRAGAVDLSDEEFEFVQKHNKFGDMPDDVINKIVNEDNNYFKNKNIEAFKYTAFQTVLEDLRMKNEQERIEVGPLKVLLETDKAVLVKFLDEKFLQLEHDEKVEYAKSHTYGKDGIDTWLPKSHVELDEQGKNVIAVDKFVAEKQGEKLHAQVFLDRLHNQLAEQGMLAEEQVESEKKTQEKNKIQPLPVHYATEKAVLVKLAIAGQENLKDTWFPKYRVSLDENGENVVAIDSYLQKQYGNIIAKQAEIKAAAVGKSVSKEPTNEPAKKAEQPVSSGVEFAQKLNAQRLANLEKNVPAEMKALPNWCVLKIYKDKESGAYKKFIINANNPAGGWANSKDSATWTTFDKALEYAKANGGAGLSFAIKGSGYTAFDIDHCYNKETKTYNETAKQYLAALPDSYAEKSVSGTGVHIFTKGSVCENGKYNEARGGAADVEVFETWGFVSMTGNLIDDQHKSLVEMEDNVKRVIQIEVGEKKVYQPQQNNNRNQYHNYVQSDSEVIEKIRKSKKADEFNSLMSGVDLCGDHSRSDAKLMNILAYFTNADMARMESILKQSKLYRPYKGDAYVERTAKFAANSLNQRAQ